MKLIIIILIPLFIILSRSLRCALLHPIATIGYLFKDIYTYFKERKWKIWNGYGIWMYVGYFGKGKTLSAVEYIYSQAKRYNLNIISNIKINMPDKWAQFDSIDEIPNDYHGLYVAKLNSYYDIINCSPYTIILIDETSTVLHARNYKNFPIDLIYTILQSRHCKKMLICTSPKFKQTDVLIRDSCEYAIQCRKLWRFELLDYFEPEDLEQVQTTTLLKPIKTRTWFIRDKDFNRYDTYEIIDNAKRTEFISNSEIIELRGNNDYGSIENIKNLNRKGKKRVQ